MTELITTINGWAWGPVMLVLLLGTGAYLSIGLRFITLRRIPTGLRLLLQGTKGKGEGDISPFSALMTSLSATIGTGNIAGVATAIALGGPGALLWMWITALLGMATKYAEAVCAVRYREQDDQGNYSGGPMYYIRNGLHRRWRWLGFAFALFGSLAGFGIANTVQSNSIAQALEGGFGVPPLATGLVLMLLVGAVILGGVKRIARVASFLVPLMALSYVLMSLVVIVTHLEAIPDAILTIVDSALNGTAAAGGFAGASVWAALRFGVARGCFPTRPAWAARPSPTPRRVPTSRFSRG